MKVHVTKAVVLCFIMKTKSNQATKILMNMFVALFLLNAWFLSNESVANTQDNAACVFIALLLHYSMLASFTWFFIQALHMYLWLLRQNITITNYMRKITVLGWGELYTLRKKWYKSCHWSSTLFFVIFGVYPPPHDMKTPHSTLQFRH